MLRRLRIIAAVVCFFLITLLFLDFTGTLHHWFGWLAKIQFLPALLALNLGIVVSLILLTFVFGRVYCSVICPLGVFQDGFSWAASKRKKNRFSYSPAISWLRYTILGVFILAFAASATFAVGSLLVSILDPYSAYGRMASHLVAPVYQWGNNLLAYFAERADSYAFYSVEVWQKSAITLGIAIVTFFVIGFLSWRNGRTYCNTICPVGTVLGFISRYSLFKPTFVEEKCNRCGRCARNCKASCIDAKNQTVDYSRCVTCMNCIEKCNKNAMVYKMKTKRRKPETVKEQPSEKESVATNNLSRRSFLLIGSSFAVTAALKSQDKVADGGLAIIEDKKIPHRNSSILPPGAHSARNLGKRCTACQLCISACPNQVLRPSNDLNTLMQPHMSYERGYCRPECTRCSEVCPTGAIQRITKAEKTSIQVGRAFWIRENCVVINDEVQCKNCERHCPVGAIQLVSLDASDPDSLKIPAVDNERCIGCGACENLCPARPFSAIYVEGNVMHRTV